MPANPSPGPYPYTPTPYHLGNPSTYNKVIKATAPFTATGSYAVPAAFYVSGSIGAQVTLVNGGQFQATPAAANPSMIYEMGVLTVDVGTVYLLYR